MVVGTPGDIAGYGLCFVGDGVLDVPVQAAASQSHTLKQRCHC